MINYNDTDEYNSIETGNTVYISGLPGKNNSFLNNKIGIVKDILLTCDNGKISYLAKIIMQNETEPSFINFEYIFLIGKKMSDGDIKSIVWEENPFDHYIHKRGIVLSYPFLDEYGQIMAVSNDINDRKHLFLYSGIN